MAEFMSTHDETHIIIIGAGVTGLVLAQALQRHGIPFTIFERDPDPSYRGRGWGLTVHWALDTFLALLPQNIIDRLPETYVNPVAVAAGEKGHFPFFDLRTGECKSQLPSPKRIRVRRERLRTLLMEGIDVVWSHTLTSITHPTPQTVTAHFSTPRSNLVSATGTLLIGADGSHSTVRSYLFPGNCTNTRLPIRFFGIIAPLPPPLAFAARELDPFFFHGGDPLADVFLYFSFFSTLAATERAEDKGQWEAQMCVSYPYRAGFWGRNHPMEVPEGDEERVNLLKEFADGWAAPFREMVMSLAEDTPVKTLPVEDYLPEEEGTGARGEGKVALVGDAGHAMTIYRGEAVNHGIKDIQVLLSQILPVLLKSKSPSQSQSPSPSQSSTSSTPSTPNPSTTTLISNAIAAYDQEMRTRTRPAVLASRRAAMDAHDYKRLRIRIPSMSDDEIERGEGEEEEGLLIRKIPG